VDRTVTGPAVPLTVHRPFFAELPAAGVVIQPGQTVMLKGTLRRQPIFKEPIQLRVEGLPPGVTLATPPAPVPPTANEFQLALKADAKAAETTMPATLKLTCTATIAGQAYTHPAVTAGVQVKK